MTDKIIAALVATFVFIAVALCITFFIWLGWCWLLPMIWPSVPAVFINPNYWAFSAVYMFLRLIF